MTIKSQAYALSLGLVLSLAPSLSAQDRMAFLVGPQEGLTKLAQSLESAGFAVTRKESPGKSLRSDLEKFAERCPNGGVSLFYFAGTGNRYARKETRTIVKDDGSKEKETTLVPANGIWLDEQASIYDTREIARVFREKSTARWHLVFYDCPRAGARAKPDEQGLLALNPFDYAAGLVCSAMPPEQVMPAGRQSVLAECLARHLTAKNAELGTVMRRVQAEVAKASGGAQKIWFRFGTKRDEQARVLPDRKRNISTAVLPPADPRPGDEWINSLGMIFCWCPPGSFTMGIDGPVQAQTRDAKPVEVTLSEGFWIAKFEVANGDYMRARRKGIDAKALVPHANVPLTLLKGPNALDFGPKQLDPVEQKAGRLPEGWGYRLPTEAEWEYACRAGSSTTYAFGASPDALHRYGNFADASLYRDDDALYYCSRAFDDGVGKRPAPIGSYEPNAWGIHDMHGNVSEFVRDTYLPQLPGGTDPLGRKEKGGDIVQRGGAWCSLPAYCRSGFRHYTQLSHNDGGAQFRGLRVVLAKKKPAAEKK